MTSSPTMSPTPSHLQLPVLNRTKAIQMKPLSNLNLMQTTPFNFNFKYSVLTYMLNWIYNFSFEFIHLLIVVLEPFRIYRIPYRKFVFIFFIFLNLILTNKTGANTYLTYTMRYHFTINFPILFFLHFCTPHKLMHMCNITCLTTLESTFYWTIKIKEYMI